MGTHASIARGADSCQAFVKLNADAGRLLQKGGRVFGYR